jgi:hypothetical protein
MNFRHLLTARSWATPVRRSHSAQHTSDDDIQFTGFKRNTSGRQRKSQPPFEDSKDENDRLSISLSQMINEHGFAPASEPTLKTFIEHHDEMLGQEPPGIESSGMYIVILVVSFRRCDRY